MQYRSDLVSCCVKGTVVLHRSGFASPQCVFTFAQEAELNGRRLDGEI